jgi:hypothetical protein
MYGIATMLTTTLPLLALLLFLISATNAQRTVYRDADTGSCEDLDLPTEGTYRNGYQWFCRTYLHPSKGPHKMISSKPLLGTSDLQSYKKTKDNDGIVKWVYSISVWRFGLAEGTKDMEINQSMCEHYFEKVITNTEQVA